MGFEGWCLDIFFEVEGGGEAIVLIPINAAGAARWVKDSKTPDNAGMVWEASLYQNYHEMILTAQHGAFDGSGSMGAGLPQSTDVLAWIRSTNPARRPFPFWSLAVRGTDKETRGTRRPPLIGVADLRELQPGTVIASRFLGSESSGACSCALQ